MKTLQKSVESIVLSEAAENRIFHRLKNKLEQKQSLRSNFPKLSLLIALSTIFVVTIFCCSIVIPMALNASVPEQQLPKQQLVYKYTFNRKGLIVTGLGKENEVTDIVIPSEYNGIPVTAIDNSAFIGTNITSVKISEGITEIGVVAFLCCS